MLVLWYCIAHNHRLDVFFHLLVSAVATSPQSGQLLARRKMNDPALSASALS